MPALALLFGAFIAAWVFRGKNAVLGVLDVPQRVVGYVRGVAQDITVLSIGDGFWLREDAARAWKQLAQKAQASGTPLTVHSAFRFMEEQIQLWNAYTLDSTNEPQAARPGYSNHQSGTAVDVAVQSSNTSPTYLWLAANAPAYGWTNVGAHFSKPEFWHWEFSPQGVQL